ncbi:zf-C3HC-domain-containing protein [Aaosphaeria arxii CBS 175.79]|uniref:Zf-C3HC-domain-containing protein n=1 Tax=Aaosphaeria arxii CBS 175.79 TaxID=1450172 RepID=A0A6A5Y5R7_9PLEO|nr:zf-C3HC-domain-containing protein [Aaosphaeria arxii CBS 175.79]KAF2020892.1 zf-C3HC-domain-containing protein [Aaosphaeria arxii CBS 175.79]
MANDQQPALATTKRKFHKLLDNLAASTSTTSLASTLHESNASVSSFATIPSPEPPSKRSRTSDVGVEQPRSVSGGERVRALQEKLFTPRKGLDRMGGTVRKVGGRSGVQASEKPLPPTPTTPRKAPNFQPYSQEQFLGRLKTFADVKKWTSKPDAIGEVEWAKRGWVCAGWNTVACKGGCEARVPVRLRPKRKDSDDKEIDMSEDMSVEIDDGLVEKYRERIVDGHHDECLWRKAGCKDEIYHIPIPNRSKSTAELLERYRSFKAIAAELPLLENITYPDPQVKQIVERIPSTLFTSSGVETINEVPSSENDFTAFAFALFGWAGISESKIALATCGHCFQRIGLWLSQDKRLKEMSAKLDVPIESLRLNLVESHREHCPWKNPITQGNPTDGPIANMAAWQTLEFLLLGTRKRREEAHKSVASIDVGSFRESIDDERPTTEDRNKEGDSLNEKWQKFKAKLRRTASRKSMKSSKSIKSVKSAKSVKSVGERDD